MRRDQHLLLSNSADGDRPGRPGDDARSAALSGLRAEHPADDFEYRESNDPAEWIDGPVNFTVGDAETPAANLQLSGVSSNPTLVPNGNIVFGGSGTDRTVTVTPAAGQSGTATITVTVNDGPHDTSTNFVVTVNPIVTTTQTFTNAAAITILDNGPGAPYPSTINVAGMTGTVEQRDGDPEESEPHLGERRGCAAGGAGGTEGVGLFGCRGCL